MRRAVVLVAVAAVASVAAAGAAGYGPLAGVVAETPGASGFTDGGGTPGTGSGDRGGSGASGDGGGASSDGDGSDGSGGSSDGGDAGDGSSGDGDTATGGGRDPGPPFTIAVESIETCGRTCRDVTLRVTNARTVTATGVAVVARIYAGERDDDGDRVWRGSAALGTLGPHESVTVTRRVKLGFVDAGKVERNGGWMTIRTTVTGDDAEATFVSERDVA